MEVIIQDEEGSDSEHFVYQTPGTDLSHLQAWGRMVQELFGHKSIYLVARNDQGICGVLPLSQVKSRLFGNRLVSQPFSDYGGPIATCSQAADALYDKAVEIAKGLGCQYIEFRNLDPMPQPLALRTDKACMFLDLAPDPRIVWDGLRPQIRNRIRRAQNSKIEVTSGGLDLLDDFYRLWTLRMCQLGTPCYPRGLFEAILRRFPRHSRIFLATYNGQAIGAIFAYMFNDWARTRWGASLREYDSLSPNYLLNWFAIEFYCRAGAKRFDFGRSTVGSSQYTFKERWGARPANLNWQYWTADGREPPIARPDAPAYRWKIGVWKRLPVAFTRIAGPWISKALV